jgi:hypothetical protein
VGQIPVQKLVVKLSNTSKLLLPHVAKTVSDLVEALCGVDAKRKNDKKYK